MPYRPVIGENFFNFFMRIFLIVASFFFQGLNGLCACMEDFGLMNTEVSEKNMVNFRFFFRICNEREGCYTGKEFQA